MDNNQFSEQNTPRSLNEKDQNVEKFLEIVGKTNHLLEALVKSHESQTKQLEKLNETNKSQTK